MTRISSLFWLSLIAAFTLPISETSAQQFPATDGRHFPLNQMMPPGMAAEWAHKAGRFPSEYFQPVKVSLPSTGRVTFFEGSVDHPHELPAPAQAGLVVGRLYRLRLSDMPEFPSVDFYPSIELIDRLHPPAGKVEEFPIEFELTAEELGWARDGRLLTKVIYLEQPNRIPLTMLAAEDRTKTIEPYLNVVAEADRLGRPVAIVRMGGRTPDPHQPDPAFFGPGGPIRIVQAGTQARQGKSNATGQAQSGVFRIGPKVSSGIAKR